MTAHTVEHHPEEQRFILPCEGWQARLDYRLLRPDAGSAPAGVDFTYTYVPPELRGRGLAEALVRSGLAWAREQNYEIRASCWYVAKFLR